MGPEDYYTFMLSRQRLQGPDHSLSHLFSRFFSSVSNIERKSNISSSLPTEQPYFHSLYIYSEFPEIQESQVFSWHL